MTSTPTTSSRLTEGARHRGLRQPRHLAVPGPLPARAAADLSGVRFLFTGGAPVPEPLIRAYTGAGPDSAAGLRIVGGRAGRVAASARNRAQQGLALLGRHRCSFGRQNRRARRRRCGARPGGGALGTRPERHGRVLEPARGHSRGAYARRMAPDGRCGASRRGRGTSGSSAGSPTASSPTDSWCTRATWNGFCSATPRSPTQALRQPQKLAEEQGAIAFVVVAPGAETTEQASWPGAGEHLAAHQVPARVTFADRLPRNSVGKLIRAELPKSPLSAQPWADRARG